MKEKIKIKILVCLLSITSIIFTSCVKQSDCDCGLTGKFIYLDEPYITDSSFYIKDKKIKAHFFSDSNQIFHIYGTIPTKFEISDTSIVNICLQTPYSGRTLDLTKDVYYITCIEQKN